MSPPDAVLSFLCSLRFHHQLTLPAHPGTGAPTPYRISYADYGDSSSSAVVLFFGGLMGGRFSYAPLDHLARAHGVRIIHADRPGIGGTDAVALEDRIRTYVSALPHLLAHLGIAHVALASHSFGAVYLLNTLLLYPQLLHPERPYVAFFAPWVHPEHSRIVHLQAAEMLPAGVIGQFAALARFVNGSVAPLVGMSAGLSSAVGGVRAVESSSSSDEGAGAGGRGEVEGGSEGVEGSNNISSTPSIPPPNLTNPITTQHLRLLIPYYLFAEANAGVGQDAQLCVRKPRRVPWSAAPLAWTDMDDAAAQVRAQIRGAVQSDSQSNTQSNTQSDPQNKNARAWRIDAFHAQTDSMVGTKGRAWFDACWAGEGEGLYTYCRQIVAGADHDFILDPGFGASATWLGRVGGAFRGDA